MPKFMNSNLFMGISRNGFSRQDNPFADDADTEYQNARQLYLQNKGAEANTCEMCGFQSGSYNHIHHKDGDHTNNLPSNFSIRCPFCHYCEHLGFVGAQRMGVIVKYPDVSQEFLNNLQIVSYILDYKAKSETSNDLHILKAINNQAQKVLGHIRRTTINVEELYGSSDPFHFATIFTGMTDDDYQNRSERTFHGLRILFSPAHFKQEIKFWADNNFSSRGDNYENWISAARQKLV